MPTSTATMTTTTAAEAVAAAAAAAAAVAAAAAAAAAMLPSVAWRQAQQTAPTSELRFRRTPHIADHSETTQ